MAIEQRESEVDPIEHANALIGKGQAREAAAYLAGWLERGRGGLLLRLSLVRAYIASGETSKALALAREVSHANAYVADAVLALGEALASAQMLPLAIAEFQRALRLAPSLDAARLSLAKAWLDAGEPDKAEEELSRVDGHPLAARLRERALRMCAQRRSDPGYVRNLFDQFSIDYDARMREQLAYSAPEVLRTLADLVLPRKKGLRILDLGCGTGLAGLAFRDMASSIEGIDLSPAMAEKARATGIYDRVTVGDIESASGSRAYDLALAADTFVYLGDLDPSLERVASRLDRAGFLLFTVEKHSGEGFDLGPKRRWRHSESYLRDRASAYGFQIAGLVACTPRTEAGVPVDGLACAFENSG